MTAKTKTATKKAPAKNSKAKKPPGKKPAAKTAKPSKNGDAKPKKLSALDAAAKVLAESKEPLNTRQMIEAMAAKGYWSSPNGQTPAATLYSALSREIAAKAKDARFKKVERGQFAFNG
jgi:HB1, ASXL, restriction endonuclease HTH domain